MDFRAGLITQGRDAYAKALTNPDDLADRPVVIDAAATGNDQPQELFEASDIYVVSSFIDNEDDDPRQPTLTIGYNTETQFRRSIQHAADEAEARWNYAFWIQNPLTVIGDLASDPIGATITDPRRDPRAGVPALTADAQARAEKGLR